MCGIHIFGAHMKPLTNAERLAVLAYAREKGRRWKQALREDWMRADPRIGGESSPELQQIRNTLGPSWLNTVSLSSLIPPVLEETSR